MLTLKLKRPEKGRLVNLPLSQISVSPDQPRRRFDPYELSLLAESVRHNGVLQPVSVRRVEEGYELIAGERRLRASSLAGRTTIPAIIYDIDSQTAAVYTLIENLQREDLSPFDEAEGLSRLLTVYGISQCDAAAQLGIAQSTLSNKLRILKLSDKQRERIEAARLSQRHARVLLRLPENLRDGALDRMIAEELTVKQSEELADSLLAAPIEKHEPIRRGAVGDVRLFYNSLSKIVDTMVKAGYTAKTRKNETEAYIEYTNLCPPIFIPIHAFPPKRPQTPRRKLCGVCVFGMVSALLQAKPRLKKRGARLPVKLFLFENYQFA